MNAKERVAQITEAVNKLVEECQTIIAQACVEYLSSEEATKAGVDKVVFSGYTPSFNDGEPCEFRMGDIFATSTPSDEIESTYSDSDGDVTASTKGANLFKELNEVIGSLDQIGVIERVFNSYGFIAIVHKDGTLEVKDYDCGY